MTIPLAPIAGVAPLVAGAIEAGLKGDFGGAVQRLKWDVIGVDTQNVFHIDRAISNVTPLIAGLLIHKYVGGSPLNFNRILANARVPFIRI